MLFLLFLQGVIRILADDSSSDESASPSSCPVLQCVTLPSCVTKVSEISPGCPGCPVCANIAPYTRTDAPVTVLPDLIVTAPNFILAAAAQLKTLADAAQVVYNGLSDTSKAIVSAAADKAVAAALDELYPPAVPSATTAQAVNNALSQIANSQPASPVQAVIKQLVTPTPAPPATQPQAVPTQSVVPRASPLRPRSGPPYYGPRRRGPAHPLMRPGYGPIRNYAPVGNYYRPPSGNYYGPPPNVPRRRRQWRPLL